MRYLLALLLLPVIALAQRVANTTLAMPQFPPAAGTNGYITVTAFTNTGGPVGFINPIALAVPPGETNRLFVVERAGIIAVVTNLANPNRRIFMDITNRIDGLSGEGGLLSMAFHPGYATNRIFFVYYTASGLADRIARYTTLTNNPNGGDSNSEAVVISQYDEASNHNGADLKFGADGYLYCALGDEGGGCDNYNNSQSITGDFFAAMLRIDVDRTLGFPAPNPHPAIGVITNYAIPPDNPYVGATNFNGLAVNPARVRTEFYAVGLRNPWRFSFDLPTGRLFLNDVGQSAREEVNLIVKGGNYGWNYREGTLSNTCSRPSPAGFTNWINPLVEYGRGTETNQGYVIGGGHVYRGNLLPELYGKYLYTDYGSGHLWATSRDGTNAGEIAWLLTDGGLSYFLPDPRDGEMLFADLGGAVKKLVRSATPTNGLPPSLAGTGAFTNLVTLAPAPGILPFALNVPFWSDGAVKSRWFSVPSTNQVIAFDSALPWTFPTGTVWVKHFDLLLTSGVPASARRIETRLLVKNPSGGYGVTYRWGTSVTNAGLVPAEGLTESLTIDDGGIIRTQVWVYPSRADCLACHQTGAGFALGFNTAQLNRDADIAGAITNQLLALSALGYFQTNLTSVNLLRRLAASTQAGESLDHRVRSYLQANCAQCHFPGGPTPAAWDARILNPLSQCGILNGPLADQLGDPANRVVTPADLAHSVLHARISVRGGNQMPPLGSTVVDTQGVALVAAWIQSLGGYLSYTQWLATHFGGATNPAAGGQTDPDLDGAPNDLEFLTGTDPTNLVAADAWSPRLDVSNGVPVLLFDRIANRGFDVLAGTNLLDPQWLSLDVPENSPYFGATTEPVAVPDPARAGVPEVFYRVRVYEP